jgi:hypothetical protein
MPHAWPAVILALAIVCAAGTVRASLVLPTGNRCQVAGPFANLVRAIEAAQSARDRGASPVTFRTSEGYFVRTC